MRLSYANSRNLLLIFVAVVILFHIVFRFLEEWIKMKLTSIVWRELIWASCVSKWIKIRKMSGKICFCWDIGLSCSCVKLGPHPQINSKFTKNLFQLKVKEAQLSIQVHNLTLYIWCWIKIQWPKKEVE